MDTSRPAFELVHVVVMIALAVAIMVAIRSVGIGIPRIGFLIALLGIFAYLALLYFAGNLPESWIED